MPNLTLSHLEMKTKRRTRSAPESRDSDSSDSSCDSEAEEEINELVTKSLVDLDQLSDSESSSDEDESDNGVGAAEVSMSTSTHTSSSKGSTMFIDRGQKKQYLNIMDPAILEGQTEVDLSLDTKRKGRRNGSTKNSEKDRFQLASSLDAGMDISESIYVNVQAYKMPQAIRKIIPASATNEHQALQKSVVTAGFEQKQVVPTYEDSVRQSKKNRRIERSKHNGSGWFDMPAQEMTEDKKNDLTVLRMRNILDPKRFYKGFDTPALPKFFQRGRVIETAADFYSSRIPKKQRKATLVEELLADADFRKKNKQKCIDIRKTKASGKFKHRRNTKR